MPRQKRWGELNPDAIKRRLVKLAEPVVEAASRPRADGSRGGSGAPNGGVPVIDGGPPPGLPPVGGSVVITPANPGFESDLTGWVIGSTPAVVSSTWAVITEDRKSVV